MGDLESDMEVTVLDLASMEVMLLEAVMVLDVVCGRDLLMLMPGTAVDMEVMVDTAVDMEVKVDTAMVDTVARDPLMPGTDVDTAVMVDTVVDMEVTVDTAVDTDTESKFCIMYNPLPFILISSHYTY